MHKNLQCFMALIKRKKMLFSDNLNLWGFWEWSWSIATGDSELVPGPTYRQEEVFQRSLLFHLTKEIVYHWNNKLFWQKTHAMTTLFALVIGNQLSNKIDYFSLLKSMLAAYRSWSTLFKTKYVLPQVKTFPVRWTQWFVVVLSHCLGWFVI